MSAPATIKILVVDPDIQLRTEIVEGLKLVGTTLNIKSAGSILTGLQLAQTFQPNLIILDLQPGELPFNLVRELKVDPQLRRAKTLVLTAHDSQANRWESFENGIDAFMSKPLDLVELTARVEVLLAAKGR